MKYIIRSFILVLWLCFSCNTILANQNITKDMDSITIDPSIRYGQLANGVTYYIKNVEDGSHKVRMNLYIKVGEYNEQKEQKQFSHLLEHLAFSCAKDFPVNLKVDPTLYSQYGIPTESMGGQTGTMSTIYQLDVPYNRTDAMEVGLSWFENIMDLELTPDKIIAERKILRQEVAGRVSQRLPYYFFEASLLRPGLFSCWKYDRYNFFEDIVNFPPEALIEFYKKWYQPDRMGIAIVGEISDLKAVEKQIKEKFSKLKGHHIQCPDCRLNHINQPHHFIAVERKSVKNKEDQVELYFHFRDKKHIEQRTTWLGLQHQLVWQGLNKILNKRFLELGDQYNLAFYAYASRFMPEFSYYQIKARTAINEEEKTIEKVFQTLQQIKKFGFTKEEWVTVKVDILKTLRDNDSTTKGYWAEQIRKHYCYGEIIPKNKAIGLYEWFSALTLDDFNSLAQAFLADKNIPEDIGVIAPKRKNKSWFTEDEVRGWIQKVLKEKTEPYRPPYIPTEIMSEKESSSLMEEGFTYEGVNPSGAKEYLLNNGVRVILNTKKINSDKIFIEGFSPHGAACFETEDYFSAINAPSIVKNTGIGIMDKFGLDQFLKKTSLWQGVHPYIDYRKTGIWGDAQKEDLETILQLIFLYFTKPREDKEAFLDWKSERRSAYLTPSMTMSKVELSENISAFLGDKSNTPKGEIRFKGISKTDRKVAYSIYKSLYGNASDFTFIVSGDITSEEILPLLQKYLGNLPNSPDKFSCAQETVLNQEPPDGPLFKEFYAPKKIINPLYSLVYSAKVNPTLNWKEYITIKAFGFLMESQIKELRFNGAARLYFTGTGSSFSRELNAYQFKIVLEPLEEELGMLRHTCKEMVNKIRKGIINEERLKKVIDSRMNNLKKIPQNNQYNYYRYRESFVESSKVEEYIKSIRPEDIQFIVKKYFNEENLMEFVLRNDPGT